MTRFNIRKRLSVKALDQLGTALDQLEMPPEVENWLLYKATESAAIHAIVHIMAKWPKTKKGGSNPLIPAVLEDHMWDDGACSSCDGGGHEWDEDLNFRRIYFKWACSRCGGSGYEPMDPPKPAPLPLAKTLSGWNDDPLALKAPEKKC